MPIDVLVVDDDPDIRSTLVELLEDEGYSAAEAEGVDGLRTALATQAPRVVLIDLTMPDFEPRADLAAARAEGLFDGRQVFALSGREEAGDIAREVGLDGVISKPFDVEELFQVVSSACRRTAGVADAPPPAP
jgi:CheY-like chemotaxis protein